MVLRNANFSDHIADEMLVEITKRLTQHGIKVAEPNTYLPGSSRFFFIDFDAGTFDISDQCGTVDLADPKAIDKIVENLLMCHGRIRNSTSAHSCRMCSLYQGFDKKQTTNRKSWVRSYGEVKR